MRRLKAAGDRIAALPVLPGLAVLVALLLAEAAWFAFKTPHNAGIWYSGGDATEYWTEQWALAHRLIPQPIIGYGLPVYYAWVPLVAGTTLLTGVKVIAALQAIVLVPLALVLFWLVADRLFGRVYAWFAAVLWVAGPLLLLHGFVHHYRPEFEQYFMAPQWFGLTNMADFPSLVAVLACVWLTLRAVDTASQTDALLAGLVGGLALGLKPANGYIIPAILVLLIGARRPRIAVLWFAALVPALVTLLIWKVRGLGHVPLTSHAYQQLHVAAGASVPVLAAKTQYLSFNWQHLSLELSELREVFWSLRFLEFVFVAGAFGVIRKNPVKGLFVVVWFVSYGAFKGSNGQADISSTTWFRLVEPGLPAYILLAVGVVYCLPGLGRRVAPVVRQVAQQTVDWRRIAVAAVLLGLIPLLVVGTASPASSQRLVRDNTSVNEAPLSHSFGLHATAAGLAWKSTAAGGTKVVYQVYASTANDGCGRPDRGANECYLNMTKLGRTRGTAFPVKPRISTWYRVGMLSSYKSSDDGGDLMLLSDPVRVP
jgi:hypothetical protein